MPASWRWTAREIRERGAAFDPEEQLAGVCCVAVPLHGPRGEVIAALCAMVPPGRDLGSLADVLTRVARGIDAGVRGAQDVRPDHSRAPVR
jgi:DNA-binding IclR family transcriptional regulator